MSLIYNAILAAAASAVRGRGRFVSPDAAPSKAARFARGQADTFRRIRQCVAGRGDAASAGPVIWLHAASLGEAAVAMPLIREFKRRGPCRVVLTFFSPSGFEPMQDCPAGIDEVYYLPLDSRGNVRRFLDLVRPDAAVFMVSEYWYNYLHELRRRGIPTYLVSAKITDSSVFFKWYGWWHRSCLNCYTRIFVLDDASRERLERLGVERIEVSGNPLFDNALIKARTPWHDERIERFAGGSQKVFVAGSVHDSTDMQMVVELANRHPDVKFIIVPHAIDRAEIATMQSLLRRRSVCLSDASDADLQQAQSLIVDSVGSLAYIYRYGRYAYVGGGFTPYLHSLIEASAYGLPVAFGPRIERKITPGQLVGLGIGEVVADADQLDAWFTRIKDDRAYLDHAAEVARRYVKTNADAAAAVVDKILAS